MLTHIMFTTIYVTDQDRALKFYTEGLGLTKIADNPSPEGRFLAVGVPDSPVQLVLWSHPSAAGQQSRSEGIDPGVVFLASEDLRKDFEVFRDRGVTFVEPEPEDYTWGVRITAVDPDGNRIALRQPRPPQGDD